jgi:hypothetical protein
MQAEDRAHRIGQKSSVNVHYLVARDSADTLIWDSIARKVRLHSNVISPITACFGQFARARHAKCGVPLFSRCLQPPTFRILRCRHVS